MTQMTKKEAKFRSKKKGVIKTILEQVHNINYWSYENHKLLRSILEEMKEDADD